MRLTYEITGETRAVHGVILNRIRALPGNRFAAPGTLGGWIESEENLEDGAWVGNEACAYEGAHIFNGGCLSDKATAYGMCSIFDGANVYGEAKIFDDAMIVGSAYVRDKSQISEKAKIIGDCYLNDCTKICGNATLFNTGIGTPPIVLGYDTLLHGGLWQREPYFKIGSQWTVNITSPNSFRIGCMDYPFSRWCRSWRAIARLGKSELQERIGETTAITPALVEEYLQLYNEACDITGNSDYKGELNTLLHELSNINFDVQ